MGAVGGCAPSPVGITKNDAAVVQLRVTKVPQWPADLKLNFHIPG